MNLGASPAVWQWLVAIAIILILGAIATDWDYVRETWRRRR